MLQTSDLPEGPATAPFRHEALLYAGEDGFLEGTVPFLRAGLEAQEPMLVAVSARKIGLLRSELGGGADAIGFLDMAEVGANPARIIPAWQEFVGARIAPDAPLRGIGEPIWPGRSATELVECQRHESLLNLAFAGAGAFRLLCPYDTEALPPAVVEEAHRSHPHLVEDGVERPSAAWRDLAAVAAPFDVPLPAPPAGTPEMAFEAATLPAVRGFVARHAARAGLPDAQTGDLVLATGEIAANSVRYGGGRGVARAWTEDGDVLVEIRDGGRIADPLAGRRRPAEAQVGGWGMWLANQLCDLVQVRALSGGTVVRLHMRPAAQSSASW
jgi:anti-sigma regulatory factor (Ser/Thr protein kinase)